MNPQSARTAAKTSALLEDEAEPLPTQSRAECESVFWILIFLGDIEKHQRRFFGIISGRAAASIRHGPAAHCHKHAGATRGERNNLKILGPKGRKNKNRLETAKIQYILEIFGMIFWGPKRARNFVHSVKT